MPAMLAFNFTICYDLGNLKQKVVLKIKSVTMRVPCDNGDLICLHLSFSVYELERLIVMTMMRFDT